LPKLLFLWQKGKRTLTIKFALTLGTDGGIGQGYKWVYAEFNR
jgi:hypothetical protein